MNPSSAVFSSVIIITGTTLLRRMRDSKQPTNTMEIIVFGFILLIALLTLAIVAPPVARILAYLGMVGAFVVNGPAVFKFIGDFGRGKGVV